MEPNAARARQPRIGIGAWIALVSLAASVPMFLLLIGVTTWGLQQQDQQRRASLQRQAVRVAAAVQSELDVKIARLRAVSVGVAARKGLYDPLHEVLVAVAATDTDVVSMSVTDSEGRRLVDTRWPQGSALPPSGAPQLDRQVLASGKPSVSPLLLGSVSRRAVIGLAVPVPTEPGRAATLLRTSFEADALTRLLRRQPMPADWVAAVIDQNGVIAGRNESAERYVGTTATDAVRALAATGSGRVESIPTLDGRQALAAVALVGDTGWYVALGAPEAAIDQAEQQTMFTVFGLGLALAAGSTTVSVMLGRRVAEAVRAVAQGPAQPCADSALGIQELAHIRHRFDAHAEVVRGHQQQLQTARLDALTGLAGRALFIEHTGQRLATLAPDEALGLLYIDLDGFKALNDRDGHDAGDRALALVAAQLRQLMRPQDMAARMGGDEFVVALVAPLGSCVAACEQVALRLLAGVPTVAPGLSCSIGIAVARPGVALAVLLDHADQAMLTAKRSGKGRVVHA